MSIENKLRMLEGNFEMVFLISERMADEDNEVGLPQKGLNMIIKVVYKFE